MTTMTGASAAARAIAAQQASGDAEVRCLQELHASRARRGRASGSDRDDALAPFGRRRCEVVGEPRLGRLPDLLAARRATGPTPRGGPVLHARRASATGAQGGERPFLPRAFSVADAGAGRRRRPARLPGRGGRPRDRAALPARAAASGSGSTGPLGRPFSAPRRAHPRTPPARSSSAAASGSRRWRSCAASSPAAGVPTAGPARLPRPRTTRAGWRPLRLLGGAAGQRGRPRRPPRLRHRPARGDARGRRRRRPPPSTPAGRRRCWRRCGRCARERGVACELAMESPMACGFGACFGCAVPLADGRLHAALRRRARSSRRRGSRRRWSPGSGHR